MLVVAVLLIVALRFSNTHTIAARGTLGYLPFFGDRGIAASANELLWERFGYGPAAIEMVKEHPIDGVGVGVFHTVVHDFATLRGYTGEDAIPTDNAQNWFRHNIAELGIIGSIPLLWWCVLLGYLMFSGPPARRSVVVRPAARGDHRLRHGVDVRHAIPGDGGGDHLLDVRLLAACRSADGDAPGPALLGTWTRGATIAAVALIVIHAGATIVDARGDLWPRNRSMRFGWFYKYGMSEPEPDPGGNPVQRRWTIMPKSLAVVPVNGKVLKLVAWIDHPDGDERPVKTKIWADGKLVFDGEIKRSAPLLHGRSGHAGPVALDPRDGDRSVVGTARLRPARSAGARPVDQGLGLENSPAVKARITSGIVLSR